jgi:hypothetical protein
MSNNIRTAQFGGVGGGGNGSAFQPGGSPLGRGGSNRGGHEINLYVDEDASFDKLLRRTHNEPDNREVNIESRLTPQHKHYEEMIPYELTPEERMRAKFRAQLHNYKQSLENAANSLMKNSPAYIKEHYRAKDEHMMTMEQSLEDRHKYNIDSKYPREEYKDPDKPSRLHFAISDREINRIAEDYAISRRNRMTDEYPEDRNQFDEQQYKYLPVGKTPKSEVEILEADGLNEYFKKLMIEKTPNEDGFQEYGLKDTLLSYPDPDTKPNIYAPKDIAPESKSTKDIDPFVSLEQQLNPKKKNTTYLDYNDPTLKEPKGVEESYPGSAFYGISGHSL